MIDIKFEEFLLKLRELLNNFKLLPHYHHSFLFCFVSFCVIKPVSFWQYLKMSNMNKINMGSLSCKPDTVNTKNCSNAKN